MGKRIGALCVGVVVSLLLVEGLLRVYNPIPIPVRGSSIVLPVRKTFVYETDGTNPGIDSKITIARNDLGFRGPNPPARFDEARTLLTIGGSTTACVLVTDGKTWPDQLASLLRADFPDLWLNNAGLDGHSTFGHQVLLDEFVGDLQPDFALFLVGVNDQGRDDLNEFDHNILRSGLGDRIVASSELLSTAQVLYRTFRAFRDQLTHDWLLHHTLEEFARSSNLPERVAPEVARDFLRLHRTRFVEPYRLRLRRLLETTAERGIAPIVMTQPAFYGDGVDPATRLEIGRLTYESRHGDVDAATMWQALELYNDVTREVARELDVPMIDLARLLPKDSRLYYDWIHYNNAGSRRVAELVAPQVAEILRSQP